MKKIKDIIIGTLIVIIILLISIIVIIKKDQNIENNKSENENKTVNILQNIENTDDIIKISRMIEIANNFENAQVDSNAEWLYENELTVVSEMEPKYIISAILKDIDHNMLMTFVNKKTNIDDYNEHIDADKIDKFLLKSEYLKDYKEINHEIMDINACPGFKYNKKDNTYTIITSCGTTNKYSTHDYKYEKDENNKYHLYRAVAFRGEDNQTLYKDINRSEITTNSSIDESNYNDFSKFNFTFIEKNGKLYLESISKVQ